MDGMDICIADISFKKTSVSFSILYYETISYPDAIKHEVSSALYGTTGDISRLHYDLGRWMADVLEENVPPGLSFDLIGCHGQTIFHEHNKNTLQVGEPSFLAERFGVPVISDFRARDISVGGCGAPLIPIIDKWLLQSPEEFRIVLNIGGVSNVTILPLNIKDPVTGFDTGPGMSLLDEEYGRHFPCGYDQEGQLALKGHVHENLVQKWVKDSFIQKSGPKSAGRHDYGLTWLKEHDVDLQHMVIEDKLATLTAFTAEAIATGCSNYLNEENGTIIVSGGGIHHNRLMNELDMRLHPFSVKTSDEYGIPPDSKEALGFAILAAAHVKGIPGNIPEVTGASKPVILGKVTI